MLVRCHLCLQQHAQEQTVVFMQLVISIIADCFIEHSIARADALTERCECSVESAQNYALIPSALSTSSYTVTAQ
jgi:hypothetical protein